jgi:hypothetical protein
MKNKNDIFTKQIRKRLKNFEQPVPDHIWSAIEKDLISTVSISRTKTLWKRLTVAASFLLILSLGTMFLLNHETDTNHWQANENDHEIRATFKNELLSNENNVHTITESRAEKKNTNTNQTLLAEVNIPEEKETHVIESYTHETETESQQIKEEKTEEDNRQTTPTTKKSSSFYEDATADNIPWQDSPSKRKKNRGVSYALAVGNSGNFERNNEPYRNENIMLSPDLKILLSPSPLINVDFTNQNNIYSSTTTDETALADYKHDLPVSVGLTIRKHLSDAFSLETGLVYTYLASEGKIVSTVPVTNKISLNYLGIPMKAVYSFYNNNRVSVYASAGGMVEKSVSGKFKTITNNKTESKNLNVKELQLSLVGSVGVNLRLVGRLGLFVEPGVAYYFDDGSNITTIRKDQPFNFNLQGGLRLTY